MKLHDYQKDGVEWILRHCGAGLFLPPGLGKTLVSLSAIKILKDAGDIDRVLVIAPMRVCYMVWRQEVEKWGFNFSVGLLHGKDKDSVIRQKHDIYLINPEGLDWLSRNHGALFTKFRFMLVCDESTLFKNHSSMRFKILKNMLKFFKRRLILTGTPAPNGLLQLWPQVYLLDYGARLGKNISAYRRKWFYPNFNGFGYAMVPGSDLQIYSAVNDIIMHKSSDELVLPDKLFNTISVQLPAKALKLYADIKNDFIAEVGEDGELITATNSAAQSSKLKQIANGRVYNELNDAMHIHDEKIDACVELVESLGGRPLLIVYEFKHDLARLKEVFNAPHIGGGVSGKELEAIIDKWNKGLLPVLLIQPQAGGHGLNLQTGGCHDVVWFSLTFDLELYEQVNARVWRQGVTNSVTIHHIIADGTIDNKVVKALEGKATVQDALLESLLK